MLTIAEIRGRAHGFVLEWQGETREAAERQSFWNDWFDIFGIRRRRLVAFEHHVRKLSGRPGSIDVFWPGKILAEHKSAGEDLEKAMGQAEGYLAGLSEAELPRLVVLSDFSRFKVRDLEAGAEYEFPLEELPEWVELFAYLAGYRARVFAEQDVVNVKAAELMGRIHDALDASGYREHALRVLLVRLLFLLFADDTGVWETGLFEEYLEQRTGVDGRDLGPALGALFQTLDTPEAERQSTLDEGLRAFPYINGRLFAESLPLAAFDSQTRQRLLEACRFNWSAISPAIFGSMFQSVMNQAERRALGAHYTTEQNILKVLGPLVLDELQTELESCATNRGKLLAYRAKLASLRFFDPACGCGNFLIIAYRELRQLELEVLRRLHKLDRRIITGQLTTDAAELSKVDVDQFYGIEIEEFPARIAEVAMYLMDHLANQELSQQFGLYYARFPLQTAAHIHVDNALAVDWASVLPASECDYVLGNPPFVAKKRRDAEQVADMARVFAGAKGHGELDYVAAWFELASRYIAGQQARVAFVATNSVVQGEQVPSLWARLLDRGMALDFAHRTFKWTSEARGRAAVYVVIVGFSQGGKRPQKLLYDYEKPTGTAHERLVAQINPYLADGPNIIVQPRRTPFMAAPPIVFGSMPNDGGQLILSPGEREEVLADDPIAAKYVRELLGSDQLFDASKRWCLWLVDANPADLRRSPTLRRRIEGVFDHRSKSNRAATLKLAATPSLFAERRQPASRYLCVPRHSSEHRRYVPMVFAEPDVIAHDSTLTIVGADNYLFGVLHSAMWMAWVRSVGGRLESRYRISAELVYNTFPWPETPPSGAARGRVEDAAHGVLNARAAHPEASLADLYGLRTMPADLVSAHTQLDRSVDALYGRGGFDEIKRLARLLERYQVLAGAFAAQTPPTRRRRRPLA